MKILCIDAENKPEVIPDNEWIEKGKEYTPISFMLLTRQGIGGFQLLEVELSIASHPYEFYKATRFAIRKDDLEEFLALVSVSREIADLSELSRISPDLVPELI